MTDNRITLRVWGDYACFTRPEMKVERVSYPVMTPSAARGVLEAVFWEPEIYYLIDAIHVIRRGNWFSFRRNEVISVISLVSAKTWMTSPEEVSPIQAGGGAPDGTQRNMLALQEVEYLITAEVRPSGLGSRHGIKTYVEEIRRRARNGKCYHRPYLGVREFACDFEWEEDAEAAFERRQQELGSEWRRYDENIGLMLYDVFAPELRAHGFRWLQEDNAAVDSPIRLEPAKKRKSKALTPRSTGVLVRPEALFFFADVRDGKLDCHPSRAQFAVKPAMEA
ncbi:type I-C CRISPR-associated protein Cas5c [Methylococcus geothermalis]|uniref:Type I-C CRISPR-associated protein Cas5 n=1 Tax=Methylococcus geothermalis TaxID=2681310 RepID=A0A858Q6U7_9GAMM|nr:type I-C CRISPR-associated protein Cas5c [Methylococcus geothermalis]QJD29551.1 type I-C CRISPR-associated protein Cas5 [Methylococcus geothermalis]